MTPRHRQADRILTTHVGSLPRPQAALDLLFAQDAGQPIDPAAFERAMAEGVADAVERQCAAGLDIVSDGETSKISYATYVKHRLSGFEGDSPRPTPRDLEDFPAFRDRLVAQKASPTYRRPVCRGPVALINTAPLEADIARLTHALERQALLAPDSGITDAFIDAVSPGTIAVFLPNEYYRSYEDYIGALAEAMRHEYRRIIDAGFILQVDCPDLAMGRHSRYSRLSDAEFLRCATTHVEALNDALAGLPPERIRMHVCWGNYEGPHTHDIPLAMILPQLLRARPSGLLIEGANPRHEHEWAVWTTCGLPDDKVLIPGVIDTSTNYVEHPELVAQRITRYADIVGRERVIASTDCGLGTFAGYGPVEPAIAWEKMRSLTRGAELASRQLWSRRAVMAV
jgi:5-methyltetrahydropteroyltriglutamate--homocysteine methyltransferase